MGRMLFVATVVIGVAAVFLYPILFPDAFQAFMNRWNHAAFVESRAFGDFGIFGRALYGFIDFFKLMGDTPVVGYGLGLAGNARLTLVRDLLKVRKKEIAPRLAGAKFGLAQWQDAVLIASWTLGDDTVLRLGANLSNESVQCPSDLHTDRIIWGDLARQMPPWSVVWTLGAR